MNEWRFKLLYDLECPRCRREAQFLQRRDRHGRLAFEDITAPGFNPKPYNTTQDDLMGGIHGVFPDGRMVKKVAVFREAYRAVGLGWLLPPTGWPGLRWLADRSYEWFARYRIAIGRLFGRKCVSVTCRTPAGSNYGSLIAGFIAVLPLAGGIELWMGRSLLGSDGKFGGWESSIWSSENSQRFADPYSVSRLVHGMMFYAGLWLVARRIPVRHRFLIALGREAGREILENSPRILNRDREATIALGYVGDSVLNSLSDILRMALGFLFASRARPWVTVAAIVPMAGGCAFWVRDNLTLNSILLIHPFDAIKHWQMDLATVG